MSVEALCAFIRHLLGCPDNYDQLLVTDAPESGRIAYPSGHYYRFTLIGLNGSDPLLKKLLFALQHLPDSAAIIDPQVPFKNNLKLVSIHDGFTEQVITSSNDGQTLKLQDLTEKALQWQQLAQQQPIDWRWLAPVRLLKAMDARKHLKGEKRFCRQGDDLTAALLLNRLYDSAAQLLKRKNKQQLPVRTAPPVLEIKHRQLFWIDVDYSDKHGDAHVMGGLLGQIKLAGCEAVGIGWWQLLLLGQYIGIGQRRSFGWGRYLLTAGNKVQAKRRSPAAHSLLSLVLEEPQLQAAWQKASQSRSKNKDKADNPAWSAQEEAWFEPDPESSDPLAEDAPLEILQKKAQQLLQGNYHTPPLKGWLIEKNSGGYRSLAVPPFWDRVLQRAVAQWLTASMERLMYQRSYGYRAGRSRLSAKEDIQSAWRQGHRWVFEADIEDFFDTVDLSLLEIRLISLFGEDPLITQIIRWLKADVHFQDEVIQRERGLPQGSPLSPMMANLILDDFDNDLHSLGFHLVRYADDFVVLCKSEEKARKAERLTRKSLAEHGFTLNEKKTRIVAMADGFRYLGYLFMNDMALDVGAEKDRSQSGRVSPHSWLSKLSADKLPKLPASPSQASQSNSTSASSLNIGERDESGLLLCLAGKTLLVSTANGRLQAHREDDLVVNTPWQALQAVLLLGNHHITTPALKEAMKQQVPLHFANTMGEYQGVVWEGQAGSRGHQLWLQQQVIFGLPDKALSCAKQVVYCRIRHLKEVLRQRGVAKIERLQQTLEKIDSAQDLAQLNGYEGLATRLYFAALANLLPLEFQFKGRNRRPPKDPFNVLLSLGYTLLYGYVESLLRVDGLLPWQGFYHQGHGRHAALASDLMEPFRHIIERAALTLCLNDHIKVKYFQQQGAGCIMESAARRDYLAQILQRMETPIKAHGDNESKKIWQQLHQQNLTLINFIHNQGPFKAFKMR